MKPELRVFVLPKCLLNPPPEVNVAGAGAILAIFAPKLIEMAIGGLAALLKQAGADKVTRVTASEFADFFVTDGKGTLSINPAVGCLLAVWGTFPGRNGHETPAGDTVVKKLEQAGLVPLNSKVDVVFEADIQPSPDGTAFHLDTRYFEVREFISDDGDHERSFAATLSVSTPGAKATGDTFATGVIDLGILKKKDKRLPGSVSGYPRYRSNLMPWKLISGAVEAVYKADLAAGKATNRTYMPVTLELTLTETSEGNEWLVKLGELLDAEKAKVATELGKLILPAEREKAEATEEEAAEKLLIAWHDARIELRKAEKALAEATGAEKPIKEAELAKAKRKLERAVQLLEAAGLKPPAA